MATVSQTTPGHEITEAALRFLNASGFTGERLRAFADSHRLLPLLDGPSAAVAQRNLLLLGELARVQSTLCDHGIHSLAVKGPALAQWLYGTLSTRPCGDLDLFVLPTDVLRARDVLLCSGYIRSAQFPQRFDPDLVAFHNECPVWNPEGGILLELQWRAAPRVFGIHLDQQQFFADPVESHQPVAVQMPNPEMHFLFLCIHGSKHRWSRFIWLLDIATFLAQRSPDLERIREMAKAANAYPSLLLALLLAEHFFAFPLPSSFVADAEPCRALSQQIALGLNAEREEDRKPSHRYQLELRQGVLQKGSYIVRLLTDPTPTEFQSFHLPRLPGLYRILRFARVTGLALARKHGEPPQKQG